MEMFTDPGKSCIIDLAIMLSYGPNWRPIGR